MAWTQTDLDRLTAAIAQGVRRVTYSDGRAVEYHSLGEMLRLKATMKDEVAQGSGAPEPRSVLVERRRDW